LRRSLRRLKKLAESYSIIYNNYPVDFNRKFEKPLTIVYIDASPFPVPRGAWVRINGLDTNQKIFLLAHCTMLVTNNESEYGALQQAIVDHMDWPEWIQFKMDSQLVVNQIKGIYRVKAANLIELNKVTIELLKKCDATIDWIPRNLNLAGNLLERTKA
jgi:ribonuclease HI